MRSIALAAIVLSLQHLAFRTQELSPLQPRGQTFPSMFETPSSR
jgi:hypothetical protein